MGPSAKRALLMAMVGAMMGGIGMSEPSPRQRKYEEDHNPNHDKKCFRPECENTRNGNNLYCSAECCKLHKQSK